MLCLRGQSLPSRTTSGSLLALGIRASDFLLGVDLLCGLGCKFQDLSKLCVLLWIIIVFALIPLLDLSTTDRILQIKVLPPVMGGRGLAALWVVLHQSVNVL